MSPSKRMQANLRPKRPRPPACCALEGLGLASRVRLRSFRGRHAALCLPRAGNIAETTMSSSGSWSDSFPGNFQWSNATLVCKGMAPYGAVALEEIERVCERLRARGPQDADTWRQEWCAEAERNEKLADAA